MYVHYLIVKPHIPGINSIRTKVKAQGYIVHDAWLKLAPSLTNSSDIGVRGHCLSTTTRDLCIEVPFPIRSTCESCHTEICAPHSDRLLIVERCGSWHCVVKEKGVTSSDIGFGIA